MDPIASSGHGSRRIPGPQCCCGSSDCVFLAHNGKLLDGLERHVLKAAQLGQALLLRHEAYVADSERERKHMLSTIERLEDGKLKREENNAQTIKANRDLLEQLEQLNEAVATSDARVHALTDTLQSTEVELQRLGSLAARTLVLERQLIDLEQEQSQLQTSLESKIVDERSAVQRWRRAEATITGLQDQIDRIENDAREERERHIEAVARMERRKAVEGEPATAAGRLEAQADRNKGGTNVVSHFVNDILVDNANLHHGILELRTMLLNSNEEVERLRDQLRDHQPVSPPTTDFAPLTAGTPTLQKELATEATFSQELHIHHHYHRATPTSNTSSTPKAQVHRRLRKKRSCLTPLNSTQAEASTQASILARRAATVPNTNRWSNATTLTPSLSSSSLSNSRRGSICDRVFSDVPYDSSRPTSPSDCADLRSPIFAPIKALSRGAATDNQKRHRRLKPPSLSTVRSVSTPISVSPGNSSATVMISEVSPGNSPVNDTSSQSPFLRSQSAIRERLDEPPFMNSLNPRFLSLPDIDDDEADGPSHIPPKRPTLRHAVSHESLISISGMDIHTLRSRPSQLLSISSRFAPICGVGSTGPELTTWSATATAKMSRHHLDSTTLNRSLLSSRSARKPISSSATRSSPNTGLSTKLGDWVFSKLAATPTPRSRPPDPSKSAETQSSVDMVKKDEVKKSREEKVKLRPAGVNQSGPIWGLFDVLETPTKVVVEDFDAEALGEALAEP